MTPLTQAANSDFESVLAFLRDLSAQIWPGARCSLGSGVFAASLFWRLTPETQAAKGLWPLPFSVFFFDSALQILAGEVVWPFPLGSWD